jgi:hypothetical protein
VARASTHEGYGLPVADHAAGTVKITVGGGTLRTPPVHYRGRWADGCQLWTDARFGLYMRTLPRQATRRNVCRRIVALEKVAGSSPVGHPLDSA